MRIFSTLFCLFMLAAATSAQVVLVNSPASIAGSYLFRGSETWGVTDLTTGTWTADAVLVDDGVAPNTDACTDLTNAAAVSGKIALIDRGGCEFGAKALRAQTAGAIAVIIFNNAAGAGPVGMGAGAVGAQVTIPVVMLSLEDGQTIRNTMMTETVNITIGNVVFDHDLSIGATRVSNMFNGVTPVAQAEALGITVTPAGNILNKGLNDETDLQLQAIITHTPFGGSASQVYDELNTLASLAKDSSGLIELPSYTPAEGLGIYNITYTVSNANGDTPAATTDNDFTTQFVLSENVYCRGRWDLANNRPFVTIGRTVGGGGNVEFLAGFEFPKGVGYKLDSIKFNIFPQAGTLGGLGNDAVTAFVYDWQDASGDDVINNDELSIVGYAPVTFADTSATSAWVNAEILDFVELEPGGYIIPEDDKRYIVGVRYEGSDVVFFGFDDLYDQTVAFDNAGYIQRDIDVPYIVTDVWDDNDLPDVEGGGLFTATRGSVATALFVNEFESPSNEVTPIAISIVLSPNPVSNILTVESKLISTTKGISYTIRDNAGRMLLNNNKTLNSDYDKVTFDLSKFAAGQYFVVIRTDQGLKAEWFTVQH